MKNVKNLYSVMRNVCVMIQKLTRFHDEKQGRELDLVLMES